MNRRDFLRTSAAAAIAPAIHGEQSSTKPLNVLFVLADQWRYAAFAHHGDPNVQTPHFSKLAAQGMDFSNLFATNPVCTPNRSCITTSRYSHQTGMILNNLQLPPDEHCMPQVFADAGYATHYIGKWHLDGPPKPGFVPAGWRRRGWQTFEGFNRGHYYPTGAHYFTNDGELLYPDAYEPTYQTNLAMNFMKTKRDKPFFCFLSWGPPHTPYSPPPAWKTYDADAIKWRDNVPKELRQDPFARRAITGYYGLCSSLDAELERLLSFLDQEGLAENTLLVFTSDHGDMLGSHGAYYKQKPEEESLHIPMIMRLPGKIAPGSKSTTLTSSIDIMPTLISICGLKIPPTAVGRDLSGVVTGKHSVHIDAVYSEGQMRAERPPATVDAEADEDALRGLPGICAGKEWRALVTEQHKLIILDDGSVAALFDRAADPYEMNNLKTVPAMQKWRNDLLEELKRHGAAVGDAFPRFSRRADPAYPG